MAGKFEVYQDRVGKYRFRLRHLFRTLAFRGYNRVGGGFFKYTTVRDDMLHVLPAGLSPLDGALVETHGSRNPRALRTGAQPGERPGSFTAPGPSASAPT